MNARLRDPDGHNALGELPAASAGLGASGLTVRAGTAVLLQDVSVHLPAGQVGVLLGPNGAGKSTLLSVLAGLRVPDAGQVWLDGQPLAAHSPQALARQRALLAQDSSVAFDFLAHELVAMGRYPHRWRPSAHESGIVPDAMAAADVSQLAQRSVQALSGGERARVQLARALAQVWEAPSDGGSRWLLLDEPTAALDLRHQHETLATVRRWAHGQGVGVLAVLHDLNLALRYADRVWVLDRGRLQATGRPAEVLTPALLRQVWQVLAHGVTDADGCTQMLTQPLSPEPPPWNQEAA